VRATEEGKKPLRYDPPPRLTAESWNNRGARTWVAVKPWRHARSTNAEVNHDVPVPAGPVMRRLCRSRIHVPVPRLSTTSPARPRGVAKSTFSSDAG
jgi:hypothetical protein